MTIELNDQTAGEYVTVIIGDYAGNESSDYVYYGGTPEDYSNRICLLYTSLSHIRTKPQGR